MCLISACVSVCVCVFIVDVFARHVPPLPQSKRAADPVGPTVRRTVCRRPAHLRVPPATESSPHSARYRVNKEGLSTCTKEQQPPPDLSGLAPLLSCRLDLALVVVANSRNDDV